MQQFPREESVTGTSSKQLVACQELQISTPWLNSQAYFTQ